MISPHANETEEIHILLSAPCFIDIVMAVSIFSRFKTFGARDPHRPPEDIAFSVARFFQKGGSLQNYYMVIDLFYITIY